MPFYSQDWLRSHPEQRSTHRSLGRNPETGDEWMVADKERTMGIHLIGKAGSGKSSAIKNLVYQDAVQGNGVIVFDPHNDLADEILAELPQPRIADTFVLDLRDAEQYPFGVNAFAEAGKLTTEEERGQAVERIRSMFYVLWPEVEKQQYLPMLLRLAIIAFLDKPGSTLVDMLDFFRYDDKGVAFRAQILSGVHDRSVRTFFTDEYDNLSEDERRRRAQSLVTRLQSLFIGRALPKGILGQRVSSVDWRKVVEQRQIVLVKLPTTTMREDARLVGTILMSQISAAVFSLSDLPPAQRPPCCLYVDEVSQFTTPDFERLVVEGRKFNVRLCIAHQNQGQLPEYLVRAANGMHTQFIFRVTPEDAPKLATVFPEQQAEPSRDAVDPNAVKYLLDHGSTDPLVKVFIETYLRPLKSHRKGDKIAIERQYFDVNWTQTLLWGAKAGMGMANYEEEDPTIYLDNLFRDVMQTGNPMLPIPWKALAGLANGGMGFYGALGGLNQRVDLTDQLQFPAHLANQTARGFVWYRHPESEREQLMHCIFHLRMTMMALAKHPLMKGGKTPSIDFAQILIQLPVRMALVRSGDAAGQIVTNDTPAPLTGEALRARKFFVQQATHQRYCHPRDQIERLIDDTTPPDEFTLGRWEAVESDDGSSNQSNPDDQGDS